MNYYIDLFSGAGGTTCAIEEVHGAKVIAAVNHDALAIESHKENHPDILHFVEDVRNMEVIRALKKLVNQLRKAEPDCKIFIWASLECTNFSNSKGGKPRDADSRSLAKVLFKYEEAIHPDGFWIENVREFMSWGPLDENGKPISKLAGTDYIKWVNRMIRYGLDFDWRMLCSADFGGLTIRKRYFAQFNRSHVPIVWPQPSHSKQPFKDACGEKKLWRAVKEILDFSDTGESIFKPGRIRSEKTFARVYAGLIKHVAGGKEPNYMVKYHGNSTVSSVENPACTLTSKDRLALIHPIFMVRQKPDETQAYSKNDPERTGVTPLFIEKRFSSDKNHSSLNSPAGSILCNDKNSLVSAEHFIMKNYSQGGRHASVDDPNGTIVTVPKDNVVTLQPWLMDTNYNNTGSSVENPAPTQLACRKHHYLVQVETGDLGIILYEDDNETMRKIKLFMAAYGIIDIYMRMLTIEELLQIQGFPKDYILCGTKADQKKFIGNSVEKHVGVALISEQVRAINAKSKAS